MTQKVDWTKDIETLERLFNEYTPTAEGKLQQDRREFFAALNRLCAKLESVEEALTR